MNPFTLVSITQGIQSTASAADDALSSRPSVFSKSATLGGSVSSIGNAGGGGGGSGTLSPSNAPGTPSMRSRTVESADLCGDSLYIGTSDGYILHYMVEVIREVGHVPVLLINLDCLPHQLSWPERECYD
jgi:hypothetical protein